MLDLCRKLPPLLLDTIVSLQYFHYITPGLNGIGVRHMETWKVNADMNSVRVVRIFVSERYPPDE